MKRYQVTQTATAEVWAKNEMEAIEYATGEFFAFPEYNHEVTDTTPRHALNEIAEALKGLGVAVYLDDYRNNLHDFLRVSVTHSHPDDDENAFDIMCTLNDQEVFDGQAYVLWRDGEEVCRMGATWHPLTIAVEFHRAMLADVEKRNPKNIAELADIAEALNGFGFTAEVVDLGRFEGQPKLITIQTPKGMKYDLYQNLTDAETIAGTGYYLMTDEMEEVANEIPNDTADKVAGIVAYNLGRADFDLESNR